MSRLFDALNGAADGAFVIDDKLRIVFWNKAAEKILGFKNEDVVGKLCYQLLRGYDNKENLVCNAQCRVAELTSKSEPVPNYDIRMMAKSGDNCWLNMSVFTYKMNDDKDKSVIVHLFHDLDQRSFDQKYLTDVIEAIRRYQDVPSNGNFEQKSNVDGLTLRELEILTLLAKGRSTREIARQLSISPNTVRNHIQNILQKLQVRTRLEAVTHAIKNDLVNI